MIEARTKILVNSIRKLYRRSAWKNIRRILKKSHGADIAVLLEEFDRAEMLHIFSLIDSFDKRAEVISHLDSRTQKDLILSLDKKEVQELVSEMESDDAADLLGALPKDKSQEILDTMERESSEDVADLMRYPEDSAGGIMSTDFLALNQNLSVEEAISKIQNNPDDNVVTFYIYVVDDENHLVGVLSLKHLILSKPKNSLKNIMSTDIISVELSTDQEEVARIVERYDYLSLPVVNDSQKLEGIITVDDVIDVIRAEGTDDFLAMGRASDAQEEGFLRATMARFPWLIFSFLGGGFCFFLIYFFGNSHYHEHILLLIAAMIPLLLSLGATSGGQSATLSVGLINTGKYNHHFVSHLFFELIRGLIFGLVFATCFYGMAFYLLDHQSIHLTLSIIVGLQVILSMFVGTVIPFLLDKLGYDPSVGSVPIFAVVADILAILLLFSIAI